MYIVILAKEKDGVESQMSGELILHSLNFLLRVADSEKVLHDLQSLLFSIHHCYYCI